jgi:hypothetical protein
MLYWPRIGNKLGGYSKQEQRTMEQIEDIGSPEWSADEAPKARNVGRTVAIVAAVILFLVAMGACVYFLATNAALAATVRDLSIIVLALVTIVIGLFLGVLIFQLQSLIALLRDEIRPILESANKTASTVRGTTTFVSDAVVNPMIQAAGFAAAMQRGIKTLVGGPNRNRSASEQRRREGESRNTSV